MNRLRVFGLVIREHDLEIPLYPYLNISQGHYEIQCDLY